MGFLAVAFYFLKQVPIFFSCSRECWNADLLWCLPLFHFPSVRRLILQWTAPLVGLFLAIDFILFALKMSEQSSERDQFNQQTWWPPPLAKKKKNENCDQHVKLEWHSVERISQPRPSSPPLIQSSLIQNQIKHPLDTDVYLDLDLIVLTCRYQPHKYTKIDGDKKWSWMDQKHNPHLRKQAGLKAIIGLTFFFSF